MARSLFAPVSIAPLCNATRRLAPDTWHPELEEALRDLPAGSQRYWGIPFELAAADGEGEASPSYLLLGSTGGAASAASIPIPADPQGRAPTYFVFLHVCGTPAGTTEPSTARGMIPVSVSRLGQHLADYALVYGEGAEHRQPIRCRFEVNGGRTIWGQRAFAARRERIDAPIDYRGPHGRDGWGRAQTSVQSFGGLYWLYALPNPHPDRPLTAIRLEAAPGAEDIVIAVAGVTAFYGADNPLRHERLRSFRVDLPEEMLRELRGGSDRRPDPTSVRTSIDMGVIARKYAVPAFDPDAWLAGDGITTPAARPSGQPALVLDVTANADATLTVGDHEVPLRPAYESGAARSESGAVRVEVVTSQRTWMHVSVNDPSSGAPAPSRIHFRSPDGRYLPPYGYRQDVNANWFEDYGADLRHMGTQYAYVDGTFQMEMPVGDVYVEVFRGFEHRPLRQKLSIAPGQRTLRLSTERPLDWRSRGWVTADTHVHFISPQTAWLQGRAEGLNLINLLASQWGDLFTNVGDISGGLSGVSRDETLIWVGTENRQHLLGHMSLLGVKGEPVFPMTTGGVDESYIGDPTWNTLAEWADEARAKDGVVVIPHFPNPYCEVTADIVLGKIDGVELNMSNWQLQLQEWYRYLNCGYRVAAVGGTDKMGAYMPVGAIRTYALLDEAARAEPFTFEAWAAAVRRGRTFTTTGPLVDLIVEGHVPGDEITLPDGGGTLHVEARCDSVVPFESLEVVVNGQVVAREDGPAAVSPDGTYRVSLRGPIEVPGSAWIAARVGSRMESWIGSPRIVAAHTSPVYVVAGGAELFSPSDATYMLTLLEGGLTWLDTLSIPASPERHTRARRVFEDARSHLHDRLHNHGHGHYHDSGHAH